MERLLREFKLDVQTFFDANFHLDRRVLRRLLADVLHDELFLFRDPVVVAVDHDVHVVSQAHNDAVVRLELLLHSVERKVICHVISEGARRLQVAHKLQEGGVLVFVVEVLDDADELDTNAQVVQLLVLVQVDHDLALHVFTILHSTRPSVSDTLLRQEGSIELGRAPSASQLILTRRGVVVNWRSMGKLIREIYFANLSPFAIADRLKALRLTIKTGAL